MIRNRFIKNSLFAVTAVAISISSMANVKALNIPANYANDDGIAVVKAEAQKHKINIAMIGVGANLSLDKEEAYEGEFVTAKLGIKEGYYLEFLRITIDGESVILNEFYTDEYTFEMPDSDVFIEISTFEFDYSKLDEAIENANKWLNNEDITFKEGTGKILKDAVDYANEHRATAKNQKEVDAMTKAINDALDGIKAVDKNPALPTPPEEDIEDVEDEQNTENKPTLPDTSDNLLFLLEGSAILAIGSIAILRKKKLG